MRPDDEIATDAPLVPRPTGDTTGRPGRSDSTDGTATELAGLRRELRAIRRRLDRLQIESGMATSARTTRPTDDSGTTTTPPDTTDEP